MYQERVDYKFSKHMNDNNVTKHKSNATGRISMQQWHEYEYKEWDKN